MEAVDVGNRKALQFHNEGICVPLASSLTAASATVKVRFQLPHDWPSATRGTLFHVGEKSHVHATLMASNGQAISANRFFIIFTVGVSIKPGFLLTSLLTPAT